MSFQFWVCKGVMQRVVSVELAPGIQKLDTITRSAAAWYVAESSEAACELMNAQLRQMIDGYQEDGWQLRKEATAALLVSLDDLKRAVLLIEKLGGPSAADQQPARDDAPRSDQD